MKNSYDLSEEIFQFHNSVYQGEIFNKLPHGKGVAFWNSGNFYFGNWKNGCPDGDGIFVFYSGTLIKANFVKGKIDGIAELFYLKELLHEKSVFKNGVYLKKEKMNFSEELLNYFSNWIEIEKKKLSKKKFPIKNLYSFTIIFPDSSRLFLGFSKEGQPEGLGIMLIKGSIEVGYFHNGLLNGPGRIYYKEGEICESNFLNGKLHELCLIYIVEKKVWKISNYKDNQEQKELQKGFSTFPPTFLWPFFKDNIISLEEEIVSNRYEYILISSICEQMDKIQRDYIQMNIEKLKEEGIMSEPTLFLQKMNSNEVSISRKKNNERSKTYTNSPVISPEKKSSLLKNEATFLHKTSQEFYNNSLSINSYSTRKPKSKTLIKNDLGPKKINTTYQAILSDSSIKDKIFNSAKKKETFTSCHTFSPLMFNTPSSKNAITPRKIVFENKKSSSIEKTKVFQIPNSKNLIFNFKTQSAFEIKKKMLCVSPASKKKNNKISEMEEKSKEETFEKLLFKDEDLLLNEIESVNNIAENILKNTSVKFNRSKNFK